jgi:hypothetical protein
MAGSMSDFLENELLDHVLVADYVRPSTIYVALFTVTPGDGDTGTEVPDTFGYARKASTFDVAAAGATANAALLSWTASGASWGTIVAFGLYDALPSGTGNLLFWADLDTDRVVNDGDTAEFAAGDLDITLD